MKKFAASLIFFCTYIYIYAQPGINWTTPVSINQTGYDWPRLTVSNNIPIVIYGQNSTGNLFMKRYVSGSFTTEVQLNPPGLPITVSSIAGPGIKASGDTVYITYTDDAGTHAYLQRSFDSGATFSDTIRIDNIGSDHPQYPSVDIMPGGNPIISFARLTAGFTNPQYVVTKSYNAGTTFMPDVSATGALGADPCDCCPGYIAYKDNKCAVNYRNSINDLRDFRSAISTDSGNTFSSLGLIDNNNWFEPVCPSSGSQGLIHGDTLISVFMNGLNGPTCYISTLNMNTLQLGIENKLLDNAFNQRNVRIAGNGDTLGVVWDQVIGGNRNILFSHSVTGAAGIGYAVDTISDILPNGFHADADIAYSNGKFYIVFSDAVASGVYFMEGTINGVSSGLQNTNPDDPFIKFIPDFNTNSIEILSNRNVDKPVTLLLYNASGKLMEKKNLSSLKTSQTIKLQHSMSDGLYIINLEANGFTATQKLLMTQH